MYEDIIDFIRNIYNTDGLIPLHEPKFQGREKEYLLNCIDSTFVSSVGEYVDRFEKDIATYTGAKHAVAVVNGTSALHLALLLSGVKPGMEVLVQPFTFIATINAIKYCGAEPVFIDIEKSTMGLCPEKLKSFLKNNTYRKNGQCINKLSKKPIAACVPMHTFGHPVNIEQLIEVCSEENITIVEDAAESLGSLYKNTHTGRYGLMGILSFNGNKIITTGGGGMIITDDADKADLAKHLSTQAKLPHAWEYEHDYTGFNYRMPNINAALGCAQMEKLDEFVLKKRNLAKRYESFFREKGIDFIIEPSGARSNYWLNAIILKSKEEKDMMLRITNRSKILTRPAWKLMHFLRMYKNSIRGDLSQAEYMADRVINIPSSIP